MLVWTAQLHGKNLRTQSLRCPLGNTAYSVALLYHLICLAMSLRFVISPSQMKLEIHYILRESDGLLASGDSSVNTKFILDA